MAIKKILRDEILRYDLANDKIGLLAHVKGGVRYIWPDKLTDLEKWIHQILTEREQMKNNMEKAGLSIPLSFNETHDIQPEEKVKADDWVVPFDLLKERVRICENNIEDIKSYLVENNKISSLKF